MPRVSNVFHVWPHAHIQRSLRRGLHAHFGQRILRFPVLADEPDFFSVSLNAK